MSYFKVCIAFSLLVIQINGQRFDLDSLRQAAVIQGAGFACAEKDTHFELVTGYVYTAPDDMLDSRPGTLMLTDCIELCRRNSTCKSANFETGLCVLFGSSAEEFPGKNIFYHLKNCTVLEIHPKSHSKWRAKRATFTFREAKRSSIWANF